MVNVGPLAPVDPDTGRSPELTAAGGWCAPPEPRCWCGEDGEVTVDGERLCAAGHLYREPYEHQDGKLASCRCFACSFTLLGWEREQAEQAEMLSPGLVARPSVEAMVL